jgi:hypothetical protein
MTTPVRVSIESDSEKDRCLTTKMHSYELNNGTFPVQPILEYNPRRYKAHISSADVSIVLSQDNPPGGQTSPANTGGLAPQGAQIVCGTLGNGFPGWDIYGPDPLWAISIQGNGNCRVMVTEHIWDEC